MSALIDQTGKKFGRLKVIRLHHIDSHGSLWECLCDCGKIKIARQHSLHNGKCQSCGCLLSEKTAERSKARKGISRPSKNGPSETSFNRIVSDYKNNAKKRGLIFSISLEAFRIIVSSNCFYCNSQPASISKNNHGKGDYTYNGIDRIDNNIGYVEFNVVPCCKICNLAKRSMSRQEFLDWIKRVYNHSIANKGEDNE